MKYLVLLLILISFPLLANEPLKNIQPGPAVHITGTVCSISGFAPGEDDPYFYEGVPEIKYANSKNLHATVKCKMDLILGPPAYFYDEWPQLTTFPLKGAARCFNSFSYEGYEAMWTAQCFYAVVPPEE